MAALATAPKEVLDDLEGLALPALAGRVWVPNPGPQTEAYYSLADELFYGGQAGGGKTDLELGLALTEHEHSLILRRTNTEVNGLVERMEGIVGNRDGLNGSNGIWRRPGKTITLGGCQLEEDKQKRKGNPNDLICFDEVSDFSETQYTFIIGWNRSATPGQRCRVVAAGNPPTRPEGLWVVRRWAAWLDPTHTNPAKPGELRWYTTLDTEEVEVDGPGPHDIGGRVVYARSRTFIPATLEDNPDLVGTGYQASLDSLPAELRAAYRDGDFGTGLKDNPYQCIPTDWVAAAQRRWTPTPPPGVPMCSIGVDVAIAKDRFVIAPRHDGWYAKLISIPGKEVGDNPKKAAGRVIAERYDESKVVVDVGGGWGADCLAQLAANGIDAVGYMGVKPSKRKSANGRFTFSNVRTEALWRFREALDPAQPGGSSIMLPPGPTIKADLCAPSYKVKGHQKGQVLIAESKEEVCKRLGRSTDEGDAVIMSWYDGIKQHNVKGGWENSGRTPVVNTGRSTTTASRRRR